MTMTVTVDSKYDAQTNDDGVDRRDDVVDDDSDSDEVDRDHAADDEHPVSAGSQDDRTQAPLLTLVGDSGGGNGDADCDKEKHLLRYVTTAVRYSECFDFQ